MYKRQINDIPSIRMQYKYEGMGIVILSTVHDLEPHEAKKAWYKTVSYTHLVRALQLRLVLL